ncbi:hypothetical protein JR316_0011147 [Psilocybe cubensis]|uniref:Uncharacterized protein n=1 Tax=Psilocybe cubensis TaxID=181762 RepID=A0ACB8GND0_PSICU|nr:hypothetical protein JR316_0011147 [Psilocybe cubensis]KAH9477228.1 hypothetical protein JR316_0011147 [Psilocybe cubensis]
MNHLDNAISLYEAAIKHIDVGHAELPSLLFSLGNAYLSKFERSEQDADIQSCIGAYRRGAASNGFPSIRLACAKEAALLADSHDHSHCLDDFSLAIGLLSEVAGLEQTIHRRHDYIQPHSAFINTAISTALSFGEVDIALEWLEQGRCLVWNQITDLRNPLIRLKDKFPSHATRFTNLALQLESYSTRVDSSAPTSYETLPKDLHAQDQTLAHTRLASEYKRLLDEIRSLPNFQDFLRPQKCNIILSSLPHEGSVIIFNVHKTRCDALALSAGMEHPLHIPLQNFSASDAESLRKILQTDILGQRSNGEERASRRRKNNPEPMSFILREIWHKLVLPILDALAYPELVIGAERSRLWWCPTGSLSFLPLHAAGIYGENYRYGLCISDFVVSSYTPTVRSVVEKSAVALESSPSKSRNLLLVGQASTPGLSSLPSTRTEISSVQSITKHIHTLLLDDADATVEKVQKEMLSHSWAHFACYGVQDRANPLESGICLQNGRLTLLEIMKHRIIDPELAFLSACQTSQGDSLLSDEVVHLAAGMLAVGYRGVIGTMWNITDSYGPKFATEFYQYLMRESNNGGLDSTRAAFALDYATKMVRDSLKDTERALVTWVPYIHLGY